MKRSIWLTGARLQIKMHQKRKAPKIPNICSLSVFFSSSHYSNWHNLRLISKFKIFKNPHKYIAKHKTSITQHVSLAALQLLNLEDLEPYPNILQKCEMFADWSTSSSCIKNEDTKKVTRWLMVEWKHKLEGIFVEI